MKMLTKNNLDKLVTKPSFTVEKKKKLVKKYDLSSEVLRHALLNKLDDDHTTLIEEQMITYVPSDYHELLDYT